ncbi:MAG: SDR family NAD(P)-dependent oxidoreductase [Gammaproteobacteria bacterium]|nr:SDR family NAD(P)-dependent oxidoreductase [Gammaproteobacteria bacterium]
METCNRILVTGGAGFIGSHTVEELLKHGYQVRVLDNLSTGSINNLPKDPNVEFIQANVADQDAVMKAVQNTVGIIHLAAQVSVPHSVKNPHESFSTNVLGFINVLKAIRTHNHKIRLVYASSAAVYGNIDELPCVEHTMAPTMSPYALDKLSTEQYAGLYFRLYNISSLGLRYFNVYGPRQNPNSPYSGVISKFIDCYRKDISPTLFGDGQQIRDFIFVKDVARANVAALQSDICDVINIATGKQSSLLDLLDNISKVSGKKLAINFSEPRPGDLELSFACTQKAATKLSFNANTPLPEGLHELYNYIVSN